MRQSVMTFVAEWGPRGQERQDNQGNAPQPMCHRPEVLLGVAGKGQGA